MPDRVMELPEIDYPTSDGRPMAESDLHRLVLTSLVARLAAWFAGRDDVYVSGNLMVYYERGEPRVFRAPDAFVVFGVKPGHRDYYRTWEEGKFPDVVFEITSRSTQKEDLEDKFALYRDVWRAQEYYLFDPRAEYIANQLVGYRRVRGRYVVMPMRDGTLTSELLGLTLSVADRDLILKDARTGSTVLTAEQRADAAEAENARLKAELDALRKKTSK